MRNSRKTYVPAKAKRDRSTDDAQTYPYMALHWHHNKRAWWCSMNTLCVDLEWLIIFHLPSWVSKLENIQLDIGNIQHLPDLHLNWTSDCQSVIFCPQLTPGQTLIFSPYLGDYIFSFSPKIRWNYPNWENFSCLVENAQSVKGQSTKHMNALPVVYWPLTLPWPSQLIHVIKFQSKRWKCWFVWPDRHTNKILTQTGCQTCHLCRLSHLSSSSSFLSSFCSLKTLNKKLFH